MGKNTQKQSQPGHNKGSPSVYPPSIPNREAFQRMNFLYQASAYLGSVDALRQSQNRKKPSKNTSSVQKDVDANAMNEDSSAGEGRERSGMIADETAASGSRVSSSTNLSGINRKKARKKASLGDLGAKYINDLRTIGNKSVIRIDPSVKRKLCKACNTVLIPGTTATVRIKSSRDRYTKKVVYTCLRCKAFRSIPATPTTAPLVTPQDTADCDMANDENASSESTLKTAETSMPDVNTDINGGTAPDKHQRRRRQVKYKATLLSERRDAGHMMVIGNEIVPFE